MRLGRVPDAGMDYEKVHQPSFAEFELMLDAGDAVRTEAGSMVSYSGSMSVASGDEEDADRGPFEGLERAALSDSFVVNTFEADGPATLTLAPPFPGDISPYELRGESLYVQSTSFLAAEAAVDLDVAFDGERTFFGGRDTFLLELVGAGLTFLSSYGAVSVVSLDSGERHVVDTGHVVAFEDSVDVEVQRVDGLTSAMDDEGLVCEFEGPGNIWRQSRSPDAFLAWLGPNLPDRE